VTYNNRRQVVTLGQLRYQLSELLIDGGQPVMVVKNRIPLGFFLPARMWSERNDSVAAKEMVEVILASSGQSSRDLLACIDEAAQRPGKRMKLDTLGD